jgi:hypothetical protein
MCFMCREVTRGPDPPEEEREQGAEILPCMLGDGGWEDFVDGMLGAELTEWGGASCLPCVQAADDMTNMVAGDSQQECVDKMQTALNAINQGGRAMGLYMQASKEVGQHVAPAQAVQRPTEEYLESKYSRWKCTGCASVFVRDRSRLQHERYCKGAMVASTSGRPLLSIGGLVDPFHPTTTLSFSV